MQKVDVPGMSICIIRNGKIDSNLAIGVADTQTCEAVTETTVFEAASLGKPVFAYNVLRLCAEGVLEIDTPLFNYLPSSEKLNTEIGNRILNTQPMRHITARHVLSHSSGFPNWPEPGGVLECQFEPSSKFDYSSAAFNYLQYVIEHLTQQTGDVNMNDNVFKKLKMNRSSYTNHLLTNVTIAQGHNAKGQVVPRDEWGSMIASSSLLSTPFDFAQFMLTMMNSDSSDDLSITQQMLTPYIHIDGMPDCAWGAGWGLQIASSQPAFWHWGDNDIFTSIAVANSASRNGIVIMANGARGFEIFRSIIIKALGGNYPVIEGLESIYEIEAIGL